MALHQQRGDFVRFASRTIDSIRGMVDAIKSGAEDTNQAIGDAVEEFVTNPGQALQDAAGAAMESVEAGELPPLNKVTGYHC
jgi:hypothetical protein